MNKFFIRSITKVKYIRYKASITLEAVIIVPILFIIILMFIYLNFYLHDYTIFKSHINHIFEKYQERLDIHVNNNYYINNYYNDLEQKLKSDLWMSDVVNVTVNVSALKLNLEAKLRLNIPDTRIYKLFNIVGFNYIVQEEQWRFSRSETTRIITVGIKTLSKVKGVNELIEKYLK